jgi:RNA recognition motif-containing protein
MNRRGSRYFCGTLSHLGERLNLSDETSRNQRESLKRKYSMSKKLYVGNLSYSTTNANLQEMFSQFGKVESATVIEDRDTGRSKGFGFVEMSSDAEAQAAISALNGKENDGRALTVNEARPREERGGGGGGYGGGRGGRGGGGGGRGGGQRGGRY